MNKIVEWLEIGKAIEEPEPEVEPISTRRFIFMSVVGVGIIVASRILLQ